MSNGRFSLFPGAPSAHNLFSKRAIQYQWRSNGPVFTSAIIIACVAVWVVEMVFSLFWPLGLATMIYYGRFDPMTAVAQPWMFLTSMFLHSPKSVLHILFNMLALWSVGPVLEKMMGHWPFLALYVLSGLGGGLGLMFWAALWPGGTGWLGGAYGASGALFGLFAAMLVVYRRIGEDIRSMLVWMAVNFLMPFLVSGIAWQAHVGGFIVGGVFTWLLISGVHALRGKSLTFRTMVYGAVVLALIVAGVLVCNLSNPALTYIM